MMKLVIFLLIFGGYSSSFGKEWSHSGSVTLEMRQFDDDEVDETFENQRSVLLAYESKKKFKKTKVSISFKGRYDDQDPERNIVWPEDTYFQTRFGDNFYFSAGYQIFNYSYMEAFHPLDIVNARILDVSIVNAQKLGEFFIGFESVINDGDLKFFFIPHPTRPLLPGKDSRLNLSRNFNKAVWIGQEGYESDFSDHFVLSYEKSYDDFDIMFVTSKGMDRTRLLIGTDDYSEFGAVVFPNTTDLFTPYFYERFFSGVNTVYNFESFQLKNSIAHSFYLAEDEVFTFEGLKTPKDYTIAALGFEKPVSHEGGSDSTFIIEVQKIFVEEDEEENFAIQNDIFLAWRLSFNDINSKEITFATMLDLANTETEGFYQISYAQRFFEDWKYKISGVDYFIPDDSTITTIGLFEDKEHIAVEVTKYF